MGGKGKSLIAENRETAFQTYRECGGNVELTLRELKKKGVEISKPTLYDWMEKFNFKERLKNSDAIVQQARDVKDNYRQKILVDLKKQKDRYDAFFDSIAPLVDNQATYAYTSLTKTIADIQKDLDEKPDLYRMAPVVMDEFVKFVKKVEKSQENQEAVFALIDRFFDEIKPE